MDEDHCIDSELMDHLEAAWGLLANVDNGDWFEQHAQWRMAAIAWRDRYHLLLDRYIQVRDARNA